MAGVRASSALLCLLFVAVVAQRAADNSGAAGDDELLERLMQAMEQKAGRKPSPKRSTPTSQAAARTPRQSQAAPASKYRKDSVDAETLKTRAAYQTYQAERIRVADRDGKKDTILVSSSTVLPHTREWQVDCDGAFYSKAYGIIAGCTPPGGSKKGRRCRRAVTDNFASEDDSSELVQATEAAMVSLFHRGGSTSLAGVHKQSQERLGVRGTAIYSYLVNKAKLQIMREHNISSLYDSGTLLTRLKPDAPPDEWDADPAHVYWNAHVDKANIATYDYSALLYLNTAGIDFEGGSFAFIDDDEDRVVEPRAGRLVTFTSGPENLHRVRKVTGGVRYVLAMWFTCSDEHRYIERSDPEGAGASETPKRHLEEIAALKASNRDLVEANSLLLRANDRLQAGLERKGGAGRKEVGSGKETRSQGEMLIEMSVKRRIGAEVEFAKKKLAAAQKAATRARGEQEEGREGRCFDFESCAQAAKRSNPDRGS